ncbi:Arginine/ornithine antiporter ArcD [Candidatus Rhodobacter oscarellae]|uniref:Arginine/ornithine antiporter ArcD n=1 Tax=Candidatus Rhodobacter oscarellae TaxID=1675527 RepID=A0A0J9E2S4_9RHOB|nr:hypothetical protein [Candidatus Rhodobacter lobularis]KMW57141.1 Arginine/ornithine antiporter ArcD [Candidatus Rhodobacter lobularis]
MNTAAGLWLAVFASGLYHGLNPGMGWPLAVSAALFEQRQSALWRALAALGVGHLLAMIGILLPFGAMYLLVDYQREIRLAAGAVVIAMGAYLVINRRHPRFLSRVKPSRLALWSFLVATAHGAGLMLVPIYLGLCRVEELDAGHQAAYELMSRNILIALLVALLHTVAMIGSGGAVAWAVHRYLGLRFLKQGWFNLDLVWAFSLILVGVVGIWAAL